MSGHSKWATIKRAKGSADARRSKIFSVLSKKITLAVREGGGSKDPGFNFKLRLAIDTARASSMPNEVIERAIKKGSGEDGSKLIEQIIYEGYGPSGIAFLVVTATDNRNRTVAEIKKIFSNSGGSLGEQGSVAWMFEQKGQITIPVNSLNEELELELIENNIDDIVKTLDDTAIISTSIMNFEKIKQLLSALNISPLHSEISFICKQPSDAPEDVYIQNSKLYDSLDSHDDVMEVITSLQ